MRITIENRDELNKDFIHRYMVDSYGVTAEEVLDECCQCMAAAGFHHESIRAAIIAKAEEYVDADEVKE